MSLVRQNEVSCGKRLKILKPLRSVLQNRVISVISVVLRETTLTISDLTGEFVSKESEIEKKSGFS